MHTPAICLLFCGVVVVVAARTCFYVCVCGTLTRGTTYAHFSPFVTSTTLLSRGSGVYVRVSFTRARVGRALRRTTVNNHSKKTFSGGCLGSRNDEERSEMRYVMRIAESSESSRL